MLLLLSNLLSHQLEHVQKNEAMYWVSISISFCDHSSHNTHFISKVLYQQCSQSIAHKVWCFSRREDKFVTDRTRKLTSKQFVFTRCHRKVDLTLNIQRSSGDVTWLLIELWKAALEFMFLVQYETDFEEETENLQTLSEKVVFAIV